MKNGGYYCTNTFDMRYILFMIQEKAISLDLGLYLENIFKYTDQRERVDRPYPELMLDYCKQNNLIIQQKFKL